MFFNLLGTITAASEKQFPEPFGICMKGVGVKVAIKKKTMNMMSSIFPPTVAVD
jgi:hypothetical protein